MPVVAPKTFAPKLWRREITSRHELLIALCRRRQALACAGDGLDGEMEALDRAIRWLDPEGLCVGRQQR